MNVVAHERFRPGYSGYFLQGLEDLADSVSFADLGLTAEQARRVLAAEVDGRRFAFDGDDLTWQADWFGDFVAVGQANIDGSSLDRFPTIPLGPTFNITPRDPRSAVGRRYRLLTRPRGAKERVKAMLGKNSYYRHRATIDAYHPADADPGYLFFTAWAWAKHPEVNPPRARFIQAARTIPGIRFEGGFAYRRRENPVSDDLGAGRVYSHASYLDRLSRSVVAFNNPAVHGCLGWKLGEYLALGKAIVSLPLGDRVLPAPLVHGEQIHFVEDDVEAMREAVCTIASDAAYRRHLERGARSWFDDHLTPERVVSRVIGAAS